MKPTIRILVIEDERNILSFITSVLESQNYQVISASNATEGLSQAASSTPDLILLDLGLPDLDGTEVIQKIRTWSAVPILVISARTQEQDKVLALDLGADDYITKPFAIEELLARIRVTLRQHKPAEKEKYEGGNLTFGELSMDTARHTVTCGGKLLELTVKEFGLLQALLENVSIVLTREQLLERVWGYDYFGETNVVDVYIRYLRSKLEEVSDVKYIQTVRGVGYVIK